MKQTCNKCKAKDGYRCTLGYKTKLKKKSDGVGYVLTYLAPAEECPKPQRWIDYSKLKIERYQ